MYNKHSYVNKSSARSKRRQRKTIYCLHIGYTAYLWWSAI